MISFPLHAGEGGLKVEGVVVLCGTDISAVIGGGTHHHIGASAISLPRASLHDPEKNSSSTSVFCVPGHKEDELARKAAALLATTFNVRACVSVGLHIDNASLSDIENLVSNFDCLVALIIAKIKMLWNDASHLC